MPKKDLSIDECERILEHGEYGFLAMSRDNQPYCIPFNYFFDSIRSAIYIHTGFKGLKWDILLHNPRACFTVSVPGRKRTGESPCQYTYEFESVIVFGTASRVESAEEVHYSLNSLIDKYRDGPVLPVPEDKLAKLCMIRLDIDKITGRYNL